VARPLTTCWYEFGRFDLNHGLSPHLSSKGLNPEKGRKREDVKKLRLEKFKGIY